MPTTAEIVGILLAIFVLWFVLKLARLAIRMIVFIIGLLLGLAAVYYVFMR